MRERLASLATRLGGVVRAVRPLKGGVSTEVYALEVEHAGGGVETLVVRGASATHKPGPAPSQAMQHEVMGALADLGLPVPRPVCLHDGLLVLPYVEHDGQGFSPRAMAELLKRVHGLDPARFAGLPVRDDPIPELLTYLPPEFEPLRPRLEGLRYKPDSCVLLHGDFWPGNVLWNKGEPAALIDWEDAAIGDPLADVAQCRLELTWKYGKQASEEFTQGYAPKDEQGLALWETLAAAGALTFMHHWNLPPNQEAHMREQAAKTLKQAAKRL